MISHRKEAADMIIIALESVTKSRLFSAAMSVCGVRARL